MSDNPATEPVNARILFKGVMLTCINRKGHYEVGAIHCPEHYPTITVTESTGGGSTTLPVDWPEGDDLLFKVTNSDRGGVSPHPTSNLDARCNRILDLEGFIFHRQGVTVNKPSLNGRRLAVTAGLLYTHDLSKQFDLFTWKKEGEKGERVGHIGRVAHLIGLNIKQGDLEIRDLKTGKSLRRMGAVMGTTYEILVDNDCSENKVRKDKDRVGNDFRFYYNHVTPNDSLKFDLMKIEKGTLSPDACEPTFLGRNDSLGIET